MISKLFRSNIKEESTANQDFIQIYNTLALRVTDLESRIRNLEYNEVALRDKVLRKIQIREDQNNKPKTIFGR